MVPLMVMTQISAERHRIDSRLLTRMGIFLAIGIAILGFTLYDIVRGELSWWLAALSIVFGIGLGYGIGRLGRVKWHDEEDKLISQMDIVGFAAILIYVIVRVGSRYVLATFLSGDALSTMTLALLGGALVGRYLGTRHAISRALDRGRV